MKQNTHPTYYQNATITCACGAVFTAGSTVENIHVEICSQCHPFYTGKQKLVDTAKRVDKFEKRAAQKKTVAQTRKGKKIKRARLAAQKKQKTEKGNSDAKDK